MVITIRYKQQINTVQTSQLNVDLCESDWERRKKMRTHRETFQILCLFDYFLTNRIIKCCFDTDCFYLTYNFVILCRGPAIYMARLFRFCFYYWWFWWVFGSIFFSLTVIQIEYIAVVKINQYLISLFAILAYVYMFI